MYAGTQDTQDTQDNKQQSRTSAASFSRHQKPTHGELTK